MDNDRKRQLKRSYKERRPEMGIVSFCCEPTQDLFLAWAKDTQAVINSNRFQLSADSHPNLTLQNLWNTHGPEAFAITVLETLPYEEDDSKDDYTEDLQTLLELCLSHSPQAQKMLKRQR